MPLDACDGELARDAGDRIDGFDRVAGLEAGHVASPNRDSLGGLGDVVGDRSSLPVDGVLVEVVLREDEQRPVAGRAGVSHGGVVVDRRRFVVGEGLGGERGEGLAVGVGVERGLRADDRAVVRLVADFLLDPLDPRVLVDVE